MKISAFTALGFIILTSLSCKGQPQTSYMKIDTIEFAFNDIRPSLDTIKTDSCTIDSVFHLTKYTPVKCTMGFTDSKPSKDNSDIKFCIPAAFTSKELTYVVGDYIVGGRFVGQSSDVENGYCAIIKGRVIIRPLDEKVERMMIRVVETKGDFFRQMLLMYDYEPVLCTIFDNYRPTFRRALVEQGRGEVFILESEERLTICEFQTMLQRLGVKNALYLDMGTWSEGFYRDKYNEITSIGKQTQSTKYQTNWLFFQKKD